jgi:hypothetical protein
VLCDVLNLKCGAADTVHPFLLWPCAKPPVIPAMLRDSPI